MFKSFFHILISIILLEQTLFASPILRTGSPLKMSKTMKSMLDISNNVFNYLALRAQTQNGLTKNDKKLLAILIIDWMREKDRAKQQNTVYWYLRQG
jgi:hypothetical protein